MRNRKIRSGILSLALLLGISVSAACAYFMDTESASNKITVGENTVEIIEEFEPPKELKPGTVFNKYPKVKNTGSVPCYIRMFAEFNNSDTGRYAVLNFESSKWSEKQSDGYYYYSDIVEPGEMTEALFTTVSVKEDADYSQLKDFDIKIYSESVQSEGYSSAEEAWSSFTGGGTK